MKTINNILTSLIFAGLFFGVPVLIGWSVFDGVLHFLLLWVTGVIAACMGLILISCFVAGLARVWR